MVLAAYDEHRSERSLARTLKTKRYGTPFGRLTLLESRKFNVNLEPKTLSQLLEHLENGAFPIVSIRAEYLSWTDFGGGHVMVLVAAENDQLAFHDPAYSHFPQWASIDEFMIAWVEHWRLSAVITPK